MKFIKTYLIPVLTLIALIAASILWTEADREIIILCQVADSFENTEQLDRLISTAENSRLFYEEEGEYILKSHQNLRTSECVFNTSESSLLSVEYYSYFSLPDTALKLNVGLISFLVMFQFMLAGGLPFGHMAWGGKNHVLPKRLKAASLMAAFLLLILEFILMETGGITDLISEPPFFKDLLWGIFALFFMSSLANTVSKSTSERKLMLPLAIIITVCTFIVALNT